MGGLLTGAGPEDSILGLGNATSRDPNMGKFGECMGLVSRVSAGDKVGKMDCHLVLESLEHEAEEFESGLVSWGEPLGLLGQGRA